MSGKTFVGFGFGPIQSGLFLYEAWKSGRFRRFVVAEVSAEIVARMLAHGGVYTLNIATPSGIITDRIPGVEFLNPRVEEDRDTLVEVLAGADEAATALPSVEFYSRGGPSAPAALLARALVRRPDHLPPLLVYTAENNNDAAILLTEAVAAQGKQVPIARLAALDTVLGKMSGIIDDPGQQERLGLRTMVEGGTRAILVEEFNRILITRPPPGMTHSIPVFTAKSHLHPFEEAKLFGHNAVHALLGYLGNRRGLATMAELSHHADLLAVGRRAFLDECGPGLIARYGALADPLFTPAGFKAYAEDLLVRMTNPYLCDLVERVIRDPERKLGWEDRLFGAMRMVLDAGVKPVVLASGAAAALQTLDDPVSSSATADQLSDRLHRIWQREPDERSMALVEITHAALATL